MLLFRGDTISMKCQKKVYEYCMSTAKDNNLQKESLEINKNICSEMSNTSCSDNSISKRIMDATNISIQTHHLPCRPNDTQCISMHFLTIK
jgi:hypothetical protein